ncbi:SUMF1/EgtB/PvdO family nonheme iron enzyme [Neolewinella litorea]|uniref:Formylglycine-generating enzyme family protein n=1 Tax=Neolewinella litorea TaxID=2562452 RepID=A0A4S4NMY0_9BACT|nr:SUMF1/EgtB/PvdO family nonheme iron enzyme [Neolewinella litorea]THH41304.1 formylglycine-generating enzyme family protein [Neolewinella litorea]
MSLLQLLFLGAFAGAVYSCESKVASVSRPESGPPTPDMVWIDEPEGGFYIDPTEVTTAQFAEFVAATGYTTEADDYGWSGVFDLEQLSWQPVTGANWQYPQGPDAPPAEPQHPVTQVSIRDARAYAEWAGKRLPTEAEWMYAATGGETERPFPWGDEMLPQGAYLGNWWQGPFPYENRLEDGFAGLAAVKQFPPNEKGLYDLAGNVWEWTASEKPATGEFIIKGGSFLCSTSYCTGFNLQQRQFTAADSGLNHLGFRCVAG